MTRAGVARAAEPDPRQTVHDLVERYRALGKKAHGYNEGRTVNEFIMPLFAALGWDVRNERTPDEVIPEETVSKGRVDWAFRLQSIPRFFLECKRPSVNLDDPGPAKQAINYSYNKSVTWAVLSNFESTRVYNAEWDAPNPNMVLFFEIKWDELDSDERLWWLSRERTEAGVLDAEAQKVGKVLRKTPVGERLFGDLLTFRGVLRTYLAAYNEEVASEEIDHAVQRLLDRLIFIRTAEDRHIEPYHLRPLLRRLEDSNKMGRLWPELLAIFRDFDARYDSQLFAEQRLDGLDTEPEPVRVTMQGIYGTRDGAIEYDFSAIDADVLGGVYEQYLGQLAKTPKVAKSKLSVTDALTRTEKADTKPFRKARGVYYTPRWVVRLILAGTLGRALDERDPNDIRSIRVLDPACGSGSFLIEAFRLLAAYWEDREPPADEMARQEQRVRILRDNIFGTDLDSQAVEIAQLNLLLVALSQRALLPDLRQNIVVGNSLVSVGREDAFDFAAVFPFPDAPGRFDIVIGNPPYIRSQLLGHTDREFYKSHYKTAAGSFDTYQLFLERALQLVADDGRIGFIVPGKFLSASSGESALLDHLYAMGNIETLVDAMRFRVFESALTYPIILIVKRGEEPAGHTFGRLLQLGKDTADIEWSDRGIPLAATLADRQLPEGWTTIGTLASRVSQGLVTGADNVFALRGALRDGTSKLRSAAVGKVVEVESALLRPLVSGSRQVSRFVVADPEEWLIFPYEGGRLIPEQRLKADYPLTWEYLELNRARLEARDGGGMTGSGWYGYSRTQNLTAIWQPKVLVPYMSNKAQAAPDPEGTLAIVNVTTGGYFVAADDPGVLRYIAAALNSQWAEAFWRERATPHAGGYFGLTARAIAIVPVPDPASLDAATLAAASNPTDPEDDPFNRVLADRLATLS